MQFKNNRGRPSDQDEGILAYGGLLGNQKTRLPRDPGHLYRALPVRRQLRSNRKTVWKVPKVKLKQFKAYRISGTHSNSVNISPVKRMSKTRTSLDRFSDGGPGAYGWPFHSGIAPHRGHNIVCIAGWLCPPQSGQTELASEHMTQIDAGAAGGRELLQTRHLACHSSGVTLHF